MHFQGDSSGITYIGGVAAGGTSMRGTITYDPGDAEPLIVTKDP